ncbi:glycosyltransferase family 2 protein [Pseudomonas sp. FP198]|uniref:glycosyltransferase family 2 protein n=1 Tax=Pseudomonas sp. FP198 TaxID=2954084 RepID=UPI002735B158|nr:glycosyltransferase family 2 protein [Pseudomonas sp. FP198]WLG97382.1 glycosyltransferase family 2 protein [Pseudomonas sp. FP198]
MDPQTLRAGNAGTEPLVKNAETPPSTFEIAIFLCTYNGRLFLKDQIDSIIAQTYENWTIYISDDGSTDGTLELLKHYQALLDTQRIQIFSGPRKGFAENFMSLIRNTEISADFFSFCDQDDIWFHNKLEKSVAQLKSLPAHLPALYCSRTRLVDAHQKVLGLSFNFKKSPSFQNALIQSLAGANTMLLNNAARTVLSKVPHHTHVVAHDWLAYLLTTGCGGTVIYDSEPTLDYRQHEANVIGVNTGLKEQLTRATKLIDGRFKQWSDSHIEILDLLERELTPAHRQVFNDFKQGRQGSLFKRLYLFKRAGVYRQTLGSNIGLFLAVLLGKI